MKKKYIFLVVLLLFFTGCGKENNENRIIETMRSQLNGTYQNVIKEEKSEKDISIQLNSVVFEEKDVIIDYTIQTEDKLQSADILPVTKIKDIESTGGMGLCCYNEKNGYSYIYRCELKDIYLSEKEIGEEVEIFFKSVTGMYKTKINFLTKIENIYIPKTIPINEKLVYDKKNVTVKLMKVGICYTDVEYSVSDTEFLEEFLAFKIVGKNGEELQGISGDEKSFQYMKIEEDCQEVTICIVQYEENNKRKQLSNKIKVNTI